MNLNDKVAVTVTPEGEKLLLKQLGRSAFDAARYIEVCHPLQPDGTRHFSIWEIMQYFGPAMWNGNPSLPIETHIELVQ